MKKTLSFLLLTFSCFTGVAQNVGIGTTTPNVDALLDISSTNKGVLFPRMTTMQRISINTPPNGLMVFDTDRNELYQYISSIFSWKALINDSYWRRQSLTRSRIGNLSDSVGIGTLSPTEWLDVDGNIRSRNDVLADGRLIATGIVSSGSGLSTSGGLTVSSNGLIGGNLTVNGALSTNTDFTINNAGATLQLKNGSNVNKGFFQIAGDDVRFGTNSGNTLGDVYVRLDGDNRFKFEKSGRLTLLADANATLHFATAGVNQATLQVQGQDLTINAPNNKVRISNVIYADDATNRVGIGTQSPTERLHVSGNTVLSGNLNVSGNTHLGAGKVTHDVTGTNYNLLPVCYGKVAANGSISSGTQNFTVTKPCDVSTGCYRISSSAFTNSSVIIINVSIGGIPGAVPVVANYLYDSPGNFWIYLQDSGDDRIDANFNFVVFNN